MTFVHINDYYINVDYISHVLETDSLYTLFFGTPDGKILTTSETKDPHSPSRILKALMEATKIIGD